MRGASVLLLIAAGAALAACGGMTTTTNQAPQTVTVTATSTAPQPAESTQAVFVPDVATKRYFTKPSSYIFSADGDLAASNLSWSNWGSPTATASGTFQETAHPSMKSASYPGTLTVSALKPCHGALYYTKLQVTLPRNALFQPRLPGLFTPCG